VDQGASSHREAFSASSSTKKDQAGPQVNIGQKAPRKEPKKEGQPEHILVVWPASLWAKPKELQRQMFLTLASQMRGTWVVGVERFCFLKASIITSRSNSDLQLDNKPTGTA
jgi:hypothetical protein